MKIFDMLICVYLDHPFLLAFTCVLTTPACKFYGQGGQLFF
ncbi:hypothetical protein FTV88_1958 [Heliorestis convoluta]|uniref:Uncharacterized protein n=1 Tax=Heliorestis convoluta TaxID=356322 RepID=A0A5Q2N383_9FIRM|nr:hypothetical protein FTV88_1958 [Heliorestis convoluta]